MRHDHEGWDIAVIAGDQVVPMPNVTRVIVLEATAKDQGCKVVLEVAGVELDLETENYQLVQTVPPAKPCTREPLHAGPCNGLECTAHRCGESVACYTGNHHHQCARVTLHTGQCQPPDVCERERAR